MTESDPEQKFIALTWDPESGRRKQTTTRYLRKLVITPFAFLRSG
jgi:hypothetical protein